MAFIAPILAGTGAAAAGAGAAGVAAGGMSLGTVLSVATPIIQGISSFQQNSYQARVMANNAVIEENNAKRAIYESTLRAQEQDRGASAELGALIAQQAASGLDLGSGSLLATRAGAEALASQDRSRIIFGGEVEAADARSRASDARAAASQSKRASFFDVLSTGISVGDSLISSAKTTAKRGVGNLRPRSRPLQPAPF